MSTPALDGTFRRVAMWALVIAVVAGIGVLAFMPTSDPDQDEIVERVVPQSKVEAAESFVLPNGVQVVLVPNEESSDIVHMVWYRVGAADDPLGKAGLAHFVEHLTFGGTESSSEREFIQTLQRATKKQDAITTRDYTVFFQTVALKNLPVVMQLEADRMRKVEITRESMALERKAVEDEVARQDDSPHAVLHHKLRVALYGNHPYARDAVSKGDIKDLSAEDATAFYRRWYAPANAIVLVYGRFNSNEIKRYARRFYGGVSTGDSPTRSIPPSVQVGLAGPVTIEDKETPNVIWSKEFLAPSYVAGDGRHVYPLQVLARILADKSEGRLAQNELLKKIASEVSVEYEPNSVGPSVFSVEVIGRRDSDVKQIALAVAAELNATG